MRYALLAVFVFAMVSVGGCKHDKDMDSSGNGTQKMSTTDDCPMCTGVQHANADGTCPKCGMKVK